MSSLRPQYPDGATLAVIQAHPEREDVYTQTHNASQAGKFLKAALFQAGMAPSTIIFDYLTCTYPGLKGLASLEAQDLLNRERAPLIERLKNAKPGCILLLGEATKTEFGIVDGFSAVRGFVFTHLQGLKIPTIVTFNPMSIFRGQSQHEVTFVNDLAKAIKIATYGLNKITENFNLEPTIKDVRYWYEECILNKTRLYVDIESKGHLSNRDENTITMIGIGRKDIGEVMVVPIVNHQGYYWPDNEWVYVQDMLREMFTTCPCVFHNAEFDVKHLNYQGFGPVNIGGDTILLHSVLNPELPHDLGYVTSVNGELMYWKGTLKNAKSQDDVDPIELRRYNARDCLALMQIEDKLIADNKEQGTYKTYEELSLPMLNVVLEMNDHGLPVDVEKLQKWRYALKASIEDLTGKLQGLWQIHPAFNWNSALQVAYLFYGEKSPAVLKAEAEYAKYFQPNCTLKRNTKKFAMLEESVQIYKNTEPFPQIAGMAVKRGKSTQSVDDEMRIRLKKTFIMELAKTKALKREKKPERVDMLERAIQVLEALTEYAENEKLYSTYTGLHLEDDGCVHPGFKVFGARTGRLSSYGPNAQNQPPEAKKVFVAPEGWWFVQFDYTNLELVVLAYIARIMHLIGVFKKGLNVHDENTKLFFSINKENPNWESWRRVIKMYTFGRNYGGTLEGMYRRMLNEIPGLRMTKKEFEDLDRKYFELLPEYKVWYEQTCDTLRRTRTLHNAFGRVRIFLDDIDKVIRSGLNFPIQSTAADIVAYGLIALKKELDYARRKRPDVLTKLILTVHDSVVLLVPERELLMVCKMLRRCMCQPRLINGEQVEFGGDVKIMRNLKGEKGDEKPLEGWITELEKRRGDNLLSAVR